MRKACLMYIDECFQFAVGAEFGEIGVRRTETLIDRSKRILH